MMKKSPFVVALACIVLGGIIGYVCAPNRPRSNSPLRRSIGGFGFYEWEADGGDYILKCYRVRSETKTEIPDVSSIKLASALTDYAFGVSVEIQGHGTRKFTTRTPDPDEHPDRELRIDFHQEMRLPQEDVIKLIHYAETDRKSGKVVAKLIVTLERAEQEDAPLHSDRARSE